MDKKQKFGFAAFGALLLTAFGVFFFRNIHLFKDIIGFDETLYLYRGIDIPNKIPKGWGPIYGAWYFVQAIFQKVFTEINLFKLYFLNFKLVAIGCSLFLFVLLLLKKIQPLIAFGIAAGFLVSGINLETWPHISHFCVAVLLLGLIVAHFFESWPMKYCIAITTVFLLSYARPELYLSFLALTICFVLFLFIRKVKIKWFEGVAILGVIGFVLLLHKFLGGGLFSGGTAETAGEYSREVFAFGQHFAINYFNWNNIQDDFWIAWEPYFLENFEHDASLFTTVMSNKALFFKHIFSNIGTFLYKIVDAVSGVLFFENVLRLPFWLRAILLAGLLAGLAFTVNFKRRISEIWNSEQGFLLLVFFLVAGPTFVACVLIYPRSHYIMLQMPLWISLVAFLFLSGLELDSKANAIGIAIIAAALFIIPINKSKIQFNDLWSTNATTPNIDAIKTLEKLNFDDCFSETQRCMFLENEGGLSIYAGNPKVLSIFARDIEETTFAEYVEEQNIQVILMSKGLINNPYLTKFEDWTTFVQQNNWQKIPLQDDEYLLHRVNVLNE